MTLVDGNKRRSPFSGSTRSPSSVAAKKAIKGSHSRRRASVSRGAEVIGCDAGERKMERSDGSGDDAPNAPDAPLRELSLRSSRQTDAFVILPTPPIWVTHRYISAALAQKKT